MPMDRASTTDAFSVEVNGKTVAGSVDFAEDDTVLVFDPKADFPYGATVVLHVGGRRRSARTARRSTGRGRSRFTVVEEPKPEPTPAPTARSGRRRATAEARPPRPTPVPRPTSSSWVAAEKYLLSLLNCTRGGGWVLADGSCSDPGGSGIPALQYHAGISDKVARPVRQEARHATGSARTSTAATPATGCAPPGYTGYQWAENIGCRYFARPARRRGEPGALLPEREVWSPVGGHYVNMMSRKYTHAGIGLWVSGGNLNFVVIFYTP